MEKYRTIVLMADVNKNEVSRQDLERIENEKFDSTKDLPKGVTFYELTDFMDACNNQEISSMEDYWIGFVQIKN